MREIIEKAMVSGEDFKGFEAAINDMSPEEAQATLTIAESLQIAPSTSERVAKGGLYVILNALAAATGFHGAEQMTEPLGSSTERLRLNEIVRLLRKKLDK